jgi:hypothetical protein
MTTHGPRHARPVTTLSPGVDTFRDAVVDGVDVDAVAAAVRACPAVDGLRGGGPGEVATYLPGRRIVGVQVTPAGLVVAVRGRWGVSAAALAGQIRSVVAALAPGRPVEVRLVEVADPPGPPTAVTPAGGARPRIAARADSVEVPGDGPATAGMLGPSTRVHPHPSP